MTALTRNPATAETLAETGIEPVVADMAGDGWHGKIAGSPDWVVNCVSAGGGGVAGYHASYRQGMESLLKWARTGGKPGRIVYTSSTSVYAGDGGVTVDESGELDRAGERSRVLVEAEETLLGGDDAAARRVVLRVAGIYGPGRHHLLDQLQTGVVEWPGSGAHRLNLAHRDDIAAAIWTALQSERVGPREIYNVADDAAATKAEVVGWLAQRLGLPVPRFVGGAENSRREKAPDRVISNARLKRELGWRPEFPDFHAGYEKILSP